MPNRDRRPFHAVLAGCGTIAPMHVQAIATIPDCRLTGLADPIPQAAEKMADLWLSSARGQSSRPEIYPDLTSMLTAARPDVVHICTPHHTHAALAAEALRSGCHVLLEKPPGISLSDLADLERAQSDSGCRLGLCFQNRFNLASLQAWLIIRSQLTGPVKAARGLVTWQRDAAYYQQADWRGRWQTEGGGVMINQAIHTLDMLIWLAGRPRQVTGSISNRTLQQVIEVEDTAEGLFELENGVKALFYATNGYSFDAPVCLDIVTEQLIIRLEADYLQLLERSGARVPDAAVRELLCRAEEQVDKGEKDAETKYWLGIYQQYRQAGLIAGSSPAPEKAYWGQGHARLIAAFYQSLEQQGNQSDLSFPLDARRGGYALEALLALYRSYRLQQTIQL